MTKVAVTDIAQISSVRVFWGADHECGIRFRKFGKLRKVRETKAIEIIIADFDQTSLRGGVFEMLITNMHPFLVLIAGVR